MLLGVPRSSKRPRSKRRSKRRRSKRRLRESQRLTAAPPQQAPQQPASQAAAAAATVGAAQPAPRGRVTFARRTLERLVSGRIAFLGTNGSGCVAVDAVRAAEVASSDITTTPFYCAAPPPA